MSLQDAVKRNDDIIILPPMDAAESLTLIKEAGICCASAILDPWYNSGVGGTIPQDEYDAFIIAAVRPLALAMGIQGGNAF